MDQVMSMNAITAHRLSTKLGAPSLKNATAEDMLLLKMEVQEIAQELEGASLSFGWLAWSFSFRDREWAA